MGGATRCSRAKRFLAEFGADLVIRHELVPGTGTWTLASQELVLTDMEEVRMQFVFRRNDGKTLTLYSDEQYFDPEFCDAAETAYDLSQRLGIQPQEARDRLHKAGLD